MMLCTFHEILGVVDTLSSRKDFFASHEHVVGVGIFGIVGVRHSVEGTNCERELVQNVEVSVVLCFD